MEQHCDESRVSLPPGPSGSQQSEHGQYLRLNRVRTDEGSRHVRTPRRTTALACRISSMELLVLGFGATSAARHARAAYEPRRVRSCAHGWGAPVASRVPLGHRVVRCFTQATPEWSKFGGWTDRVGSAHMNTPRTCSSRDLNKTRGRLSIQGRRPHESRVRAAGTD